MGTRKELKEQELKRKSSMMSLENLSGKKSHVFVKHIGLEKEDMTTRIIEERKKGNIMEAVTSFYNEQQALECIIATILDDDGECSNLSFIADWLCDDSDGEPLDVEKDFPAPVGYGLLNKKEHEWSDGMMEFTRVRVVLEKLPDYRGYFEFVVTTAYPVL